MPDTEDHCIGPDGRKLQKLIADGKMPSLKDLLAAVGEARQNYRLWMKTAASLAETAKPGVHNDECSATHQHAGESRREGGWPHDVASTTVTGLLTVVTWRGCDAGLIS